MQQTIALQLGEYVLSPCDDFHLIGVRAREAKYYAACLEKCLCVAGMRAFAVQLLAKGRSRNNESVRYEKLATHGC